jgi:hypothetical protein
MLPAIKISTEAPQAGKRAYYRDAQTRGLVFSITDNGFAPPALSQGTAAPRKS